MTYELTIHQRPIYLHAIVPRVIGRSLTVGCLSDARMI